MYKFIRLTRTFHRLSETFLCNQTLKNNSVALTNNQITFNYCSEALKPASNHIPGLESDIKVEALTQNDPELLKKLQIIILEVDVMRQEGLRIPESKFLKQQHWHELLIKPTRSQRKKYLDFLWTIEKKKENQRSKREEAKIEREKRPEFVDDGHIRYGLNHNTFFIRIYDTTINHMYNSKLITQAQFGQPLVIDCGYDQHMTSRECANCAKQIMLAFSENRVHDEPFDLHLCNANYSSPTLQALSRHIGTLQEPWFPLHVHEESYLTTRFASLAQGQRQALEEPPSAEELQQQQKKKLVYLTPHCREEMDEFDHEAIYIIGGIVDKMNQEPLSLAKAKRENIKMQRLPLDKYLTWGSGSGKSLTLNHMMLILLDVRRTGDWGYALRHVPRRKVLDSNVITRNAERGAMTYDRSDWTRRGSDKLNTFTRNDERRARWYDRSPRGDKGREAGYDRRDKGRMTTKDLINELLKN